jgi:hypothetical protein
MKGMKPKAKIKNKVIIEDQVNDTDQGPTKSSESVSVTMIQSNDIIQDNYNSSNVISSSSNKSLTNLSQKKSLFRKSEKNVCQNLGVRINDLAYIPILNNKKYPPKECKWGWEKDNSNMKLWSELSQNERKTILNNQQNQNRALITGKVSNFFVFEIDKLKDADKLKGIKDGMEYYNELLKVQNGGNQINTVIVKSPNGGLHIYFKYDEDINKCTVKLNGYSIDIRSDGGYIISPPSSIYGKKYEYISGHENVDLIECPMWLKAIIIEHYENQRKKAKRARKERIIQEDNGRCISVSLERLARYASKLNKGRSDNYSSWVEIGMCLKNSNSNVFELWHKWSMQSNKYKSREDCLNKWSSFNINMSSKLGFGSLVEFVREDNEDDKYIISRLDYMKYVPINEDKLDIDKITIDTDKLTSDIYNDYDICLCKSGTNTAKSTSVTTYCNENKGHKIIAIVSLISMAEQLMRTFDSDFQRAKFGDSRIKLTKYDDEELNIHTDNIAITLNSMLKLKALSDNEMKNSIVIIDEVNSVLTYLLHCDTIKTKSLEIYDLLVYIMSRCHKIIVMDADLSDLVLQLINVIRPMRSQSRSILIHNTRKNYLGIKAIRANEKDIINRIKEDYANKKYPIVCFDSVKKARQVFEIVSEKQNRDDFIFISGDNGDEIDPENWKDKVVSYTPKIIYGVDHVPDVPRNIYVIATGKSITPLQVAQQQTRSRKIEAVYYCITAKPKNLKFETVEELTKYYDKNDNYIYNSMKCTVDIKVLRSNSSIIQRANEFAHLFYISQFQNNIFDVDFGRHFEDILVEKGFTLINSLHYDKAITSEKISDINKTITKDEIDELITKNKEKAIKLDEYVDWVDNKTNDKTLIKKLDMLTCDLKLKASSPKERAENRETLMKFEPIICNIKDHFNLCHLLKINDITESTILGNIAKQYEGHLYKSVHSKVLLLNKIESQLGIQTLDINSEKHQNKFKNTVKLGDNEYNSYITLFRGKRKAPKNWGECYSMLIAGYRSINAQIIESVRKFIKVNQKSKMLTIYKLKEDVLKLHLELYQLRDPSFLKIKPHILQLVSINPEIQSIQNEEVIDNQIYMFGPDPQPQRNPSTPTKKRNKIYDVFDSFTSTIN